MLVISPFCLFQGDASLIPMKEFNQKLYDRVVGLDVDKYTDPYSQLLLRQWNDDDEIKDLILERVGCLLLLLFCFSKLSRNVPFQ
jgi:hypothetical protein